MSIWLIKVVLGKGGAIGQLLSDALLCSLAVYLSHLFDFFFLQVNFVGDHGQAGGSYQSCIAA